MKKIHDLLRARMAKTDSQSPKRRTRGWELYKTLGVDPGTSGEALTRAYNEMLLVTLNDQAEEAKVKEAYAVLSNPKRKEMYDAAEATQEKQRQQEGGETILAEDESYFHRRSIQKKGKTKELQYALEVPLEDIFAGVISPTFISRQRICTACKGYAPSSLRIGRA